MTPDNGRVQVQFSEKREGAAGDTERQEAKKKQNKDSEREKERNVKCEGERWGGEGDGVKWSAESSECVSAEGGGEVGQSGWVQRVGMLKSPAHL